MSGNTGGASIAAALILGAAFVAGALLIRSSVEEVSREVAALESTIADLTPSQPERRAERPSGPQAGRRYSVDTTGAPALGPDTAKVTVIEFSDFQCPFCGRVLPALQQIQREYGDDVRIVFKHLPLGIHPKAPAAHAASEAAHRQGKFWPMHDKIFANQRDLSPETYKRYAEEIGLDLEQYERDLADPAVERKVEADLAEASRLGVSGTPAFFINGRFLSGARPFASFKAVIDEELGKGKG